MCIGIQCPPKRFEIYRRVSAENLAQGDYILADLGCVPVEGFLTVAAQQLQDDPKIGIIGNTGVRMCRKGIVTQWLEKTTETYDDEHRRAYELRGYIAFDWKQPCYRRLNVS